MLASFAAAVAVLAVITVLPGPDFAVVARFAVVGGRRPALSATLGVVLGLTVWGLLTIVGLAALLATSAQAYVIVKVVGAAYLFGLGAHVLWRSRQAPAAPKTTPATGVSRATRIGLLTNLLNPKIAVVYTGLLPTLVPVGGAARFWLPLLLATHIVLSLCWFGGCTLALSRSRSVLRRPRVRRVLDQITGVVLVGFAARILAEAR